MVTRSRAWANAALAICAFTEVMAMIWSDGKYVPRSDTLAPAPDAEQLAAIAALVVQP